jgi:hypothetical protein
MGEAGPINETPKQQWFYRTLARAQTLRKAGLFADDPEAWATFTRDIQAVADAIFG